MRYPRSTHGPLIHERAVEKVARHVNDAIQMGAQILIGGRHIDGPGTFFAPTVLSDVPSRALINHEETFGPIAALTKFETEEEVIKLANDTEVGLAGYFYSRDVGRVWRVAEALEVGMVGANTGLLSQAVIPFGGIKESGIGESTPSSRMYLVLKHLRSRRWSWNRGVHEHQVHRIWWSVIAYNSNDMIDNLSQLAPNVRTFTFTNSLSLEFLPPPPLD